MDKTKVIYGLMVLLSVCVALWIANSLIVIKTVSGVTVSVGGSGGNITASEDPSRTYILIANLYKHEVPFGPVNARYMVQLPIAAGIALVIAVVIVLRKQRKKRLGLEVQSKQRIEQKPSQPLTGP